MKKTLRPSPCIAATLFAALTMPGAGLAAGLSMDIGTDYSSGKYGGPDRTTVASVPVNVRYTSGRVILKASVSWIHISGTGVVPSGIGGIGGSGDDSGSGSDSSGGSVGAFGCAADNRGGASKPEDSGPCAAAGVAGVRRTTQGFGDIVTALTYNAVNIGGFTLDLTGKIKFATASDTRGLGSGKNDYALQFGAEKSIGKGYINGGLGYKWLGDPTGVSLRNVWFGAAGGGYKIAADTTAGVSYDYAGAARSGRMSMQEVSLYVSHRLSKSVRLNGSVHKGLTDAAPDWGGGMNLRYRF